MARHFHPATTGGVDYKFLSVHDSVELRDMKTYLVSSDLLNYFKNSVDPAKQKIRHSYGNMSDQKSAVYS